MKIHDLPEKWAVRLDDSRISTHWIPTYLKSEHDYTAEISTKYIGYDNYRGEVVANNELLNFAHGTVELSSYEFLRCTSIAIGQYVIDYELRLEFDIYKSVLMKEHGLNEQDLNSDCKLVLSYIGRSNVIKKLDEAGVLDIMFIANGHKTINGDSKPIFKYNFKK